MVSSDTEQQGWFGLLADLVSLLMTLILRMRLDGLRPISRNVLLQIGTALPRAMKWDRELCWMPSMRRPTTNYESDDVRCRLESYAPCVGSRYSGLNHFLLSTLLTLSTYMTSQLVNTLTNFLHHQMMPPGLARKAWAKGRVDEFVCLPQTQLAAQTLMSRWLVDTLTNFFITHHFLFRQRSSDEIYF